MNSRALALVLLVAFLASSLSVVPTVVAEDESGRQGGELVVALQDFGDLDPTSSPVSDRKVLELVYDSLGRIDPVTLQFVPWAATGWAHDGRENITVTLRDDLRFDDGSAYDADAVVRSLNAYTRGGVQRWTVSKVNALTVRFDFTAIDAAWDYRASNAAGPGLFFTEGLSAFIAWDASGTRKYSGPYRVEREDPNSLRIVPNEHHFAGRPNLDAITYRWPFTVQPDGNGRSVSNDAGCALLFQQVHLIGWNLQANDLTNPRDCVAGFGGFADNPGTPSVNESLRSIQNPNQNLTMPHAAGAKNPGTDLLYYGFSYNGGSVFVGGPGTQGQRLRSAIYTFVNKALIRLFESQSVVAHGLQNQFNTPWSPATCAPFTPCNTIVETSTIRAPPPANQRTDTDPGIQALNDAGIFDRNGDGWREMSTGQPVAISIEAPSFALDTQKKAMADDLRNLLATVQLNATVEPFDTWAALEAAVSSCTTSCLYIRRYMAATQRPDWIYDMPEIRDVRDPVVDAHLNLGAATTFTEANRSLQVGYVSHFVGAAADLLPLLHFDALEGYDAKTFTGWVNTFGGINNFWSFTGLRLPALGGLHVRASGFPIGLRPDTTGVARGVVTVEVTDDAGLPVPGADVQVSSGLPNAIQTPAGRTDLAGAFRTNYTATGVGAVTDDTVWATVTKLQYEGDRASFSWTVHPPLPSVLQVSVSRGPRAEVDWNETAPILVAVEDNLGNPVVNARVVLRTDLPSGSFADPNGTTGANGQYATVFHPDVRQGMTVQVIAEVSAPGYDSARRTVSIIIKENPGTAETITRTRNVPGLEVVAVIGAMAVTYGLVTIARRRRGD